jgi:D-citramalate synthase
MPFAFRRAVKRMHLCETIITWEINGKDVKTRGLDSDQTFSAIMATQKMLNLIGIPENKGINVGQLADAIS